ncbi:hypothetical protein ACGFJT_37475 [Actinomadura geliboluensis]|uniref:hypothetical protein n=1 Tax=Actinomadura geliboluensis TaxID=882440 RepID=UPI0037104724
MATRYPTDLPDAPPGGWNYRRIDSGGDPDLGTSWLLIEIDADTAECAEKRTLAHIDKNFQDDLRGAVATAAAAATGRHRVRVAFARPRG